MKPEILPTCGVSRFLLLLGGPWATLIVRELLRGPQRFTELRQALPGISAHTLTHRLKGFERHGLVTRTAFAETPPRVVYELTPTGLGLRGVLEAMARWGDGLPAEVLAPLELPADAGEPAAASSVDEADAASVCPLVAALQAPATSDGGARRRTARSQPRQGGSPTGTGR